MQPYWENPVRAFYASSVISQLLTFDLTLNTRRDIYKLTDAFRFGLLGDQNFLKRALHNG
jgi:hypothetical protein